MVQDSSGNDCFRRRAASARRTPGFGFLGPELYLERVNPKNQSMTSCRAILLLILLPVSFAGVAQVTERYFTYEGKPAVPDSAQRIRKGVLENGKWHVLEYEKFLSAPRSETWYLDSGFLIPDGDYTAFSFNDSTKISDRGQYDKGKKTGLWVSFNDSGVPLDSSMYADDHISFHRVYYPGGKPREIVTIG